MRTRQAIVLAGGRGTRLSSVVRDVPKPMAEVAGRPFLRYVLDNLFENGFGCVVMAVGYKREVIESYFGNSYRGMRIIYSTETSPLMTGGAVKKALALCDGEAAFVLNGDTYFDVDFSSLEDASKRIHGGAEAVVALRGQGSSGRYGSVSLSDSGRIEFFGEKKSTAGGLINGGVYYLKTNALCDMPDVFSLEKDYLERLASSEGFRGVECRGVFIDIGIPEDYEKAQMLLAPMVKRWKIAFFDRDGTINVDTGHLHEADKLVFVDEGVEKLRYYSGLADYKIVVVTNQAGIAKGLYDEEDMRVLHAVMDELLTEKECRIDAYYFCPHHPEATGSCECRKPKPGMIERALRDFDALASECIMFGDSATDEQAARLAGVQFEWVKM